MATIEIDWDVMKAITLRRETESTTPNDVLRALFGLPSSPSTPSFAVAFSEIGGWKYGGVFFPNGTEFRAHYGDEWHNGKIVDGALIFNGVQYYSPSEAAQKITGSARNGWLFWECRLPGHSAWRVIDQLRKS